MAPTPGFRRDVAGSTFEIALTYRKNGLSFSGSIAINRV
jgi:hypothetical protein